MLIVPQVFQNRRWTRQNEASNEAREDFRRLHQLATYYASQLELFADLCLGRSYHCIYALEAQFSFELCLTAVANELLPDALRATFTVLLHRLYLDRFPQVGLAFSAWLCTTWICPASVPRSLSGSIICVFRHSQVLVFLLLLAQHLSPIETTRRPSRYLSLRAPSTTSCR